MKREKKKSNKKNYSNRMKGKKKKNTMKIEENKLDVCFSQSTVQITREEQS